MVATALLGLVGAAGDAFAQTPSSTSVVASPNPGVIGQQVTLTATVTTGAFLAQGQVQFFDGATSLGTGFVGGGLAFITTSSLALGPTPSPRSLSAPIRTTWDRPRRRCH
jgi:hypothetical protein